MKRFNTVELLIKICWQIHFKSCKLTKSYNGYMRQNTSGVKFGHDDLF